MRHLFLFALTGLIFVTTSQVLAESTTFVRVSGIKVLDEGPDGEEGFTVDTTRIADCDPETGEIEDEEFHDAFLSVNITNHSSSNLFRIKRARITVREVRSDGGRFRSRRFPPSGLNEVPAGESATIRFLLGDVSDDGKRFIGSSEMIPANPGARTVRIRINGRLGNRRVHVRGSTVLSFREVDRCS